MSFSRYCMDVIPNFSEDELEWLCFLCSKRLPQGVIKPFSNLVRKKPFSNLVIKNGKKKMPTRYMVHKTEHSEIFKERKISVQTSNGGKRLSNEADDSKEILSPRDDEECNLPENSGRKIVSTKETNFEREDPLPSQSSGVCLDGSKLAKEDMCGKLSSKYGRNDVSGPSKIIGEKMHSEVKHPSSGQTSAPPRTSPTKSKQLCDGYQHGENNESKPGKQSPRDVREDDFSVNSKRKITGPGKNVSSSENPKIETQFNLANQLTHESLRQSASGKPSPRDIRKDGFFINRMEKSGSTETGAHEISDSSEKNDAEKGATKREKRRRLLMDVDSDEDNHSPLSSDHSTVHAHPIQCNSEIDRMSRSLSPPEGSKGNISQPPTSFPLRVSQRFFPCPVWRLVLINIFSSLIP